MKHLLLILIFFPLFAKAQWGCYNDISFDSGYPVPQYLDWRVAVTIDTTNCHHNIWQVGKPHKDSFTTGWYSRNAIVTDTLNPYLPNDTSVFILKVPAKFYDGLFWHSFTDFSFVYRLDIDTGAIARVEISDDAGWHWTSVTDSLPSGFSWSGAPAVLISSTTTWTGFNLNVGGLGTDTTVFFRFTFISDSVTTLKDGWIIDDIDIGYWCEEAASLLAHDAYTIYPNPAGNILAISAPTKIQSVAIQNTLGQMVRRETCNGPTVQIDVAELPGGLYFVYVDWIAAGKFLKE